MFLFSKKNKKSVDLSWLKTDMHSHLLPGIDDGSPNLQTSLKLVKGFAALGFKKIITTPHVLWEIYPNTTEIIKAKLEELQKAVAAEGLNIELHAAAEYFIDDHFNEQLKNKIPFLTISGNMVLVEFSMVSAPLDLQEVIFNLQMQDYQPVLAHPERYTYLSRKRDLLETLKNAGCLFQLNLLSLTGYYGEGVQELAEYLLKNDYYDLAGTDLHHERHLTMLQKLSSSPLYQQIENQKIFNNHLL